MFKSYFLIGLRNLLKQKGYAAIKIIGLAFGLAASLIIYLFVEEDLSYDTFHKNYNRIVRVMTIDSAEGVSSSLVGVTQPPLGPAVEAELPEVINSVRLSGGGRLDLSYEDNLLKCDAGFRTESSFFEIFDFEILEGKKENTLDEPNSIAITQTLAHRLFGNESPIGKTVKLNQTTELHVVALVADPPKNSHIQFDLLRSMTPSQSEEGYRQFLESWGGISQFTYLLLDKPIQEQDLNQKIQAIAKKNNAFEFFTPIVQPLADVHLKSKQVLFETNANKSDILNVYVLSVIAVLILILAAVNFTNLVTAKSAGRAKEVGMRKVIGAIRSQLIGQHLAESILITFLAAVLALTVVFAALPFLNSAYQRFADASSLLQTTNLALYVFLIFGVGLLAGLYPAFVLSSFKPVVVLKGAFKNSSGGIQLRKVLVVLQFTISVALMVGTGIVYQQMRFIYTADLGYDRDQVITLAQSGRTADNSTSFKNELLQNTNILSAGTSTVRLGQQLGRTGIFPEGFSNESNFIVSIMNIDESFIPTMDMEMVSGRNFSLDYDDSLSMIINEEMTRLLKWDDAVGRKISLQTGPNAETDITAYTVVGVVKDFHFATIRHKVEPLFMLFNANNPSMAIKVKAENMKETIAYIEDTWKKINTGSTFEYSFLDEQFANLYRNEQAFATMFTHFTVLAMIIAGLGLFALSAFTAEQRKKEISIRKVLGASNGNILYKLSIEFIQLITIAILIASVIAYLIMNRWLQDFQYSIKIGPEIFVIAGLASIGIALATISFQALKAAYSNPVNSLRNE
ncbi:MAG: ABC transporter permease [Cyclobacteriaceae bacterium]|jgi:putative ABC transport system permease protein|nr:ABC transporter permease [Cyclobacteriaceae bacterium]